MIRELHTDTAPQPFSNYSQAVEVPPGHRLVAVSGQVGVDPQGHLAENEAGQHEQTWRNVLAILQTAGLGPDDIVAATGYITGPEGVPTFRSVRDQMLGGAKPASTLLIVSGLADPDWKVEITVLAAAPAA